MKTLTAVTLGAVAVGGSTLAASRVPVAPDFSALTHVNVVPMGSGRVLRDQTVLVEQGRLRRLRSADEVQVPVGVTTVRGMLG